MIRFIGSIIFAVVIIGGIAFVYRNGLPQGLPDASQNAVPKQVAEFLPEIKQAIDEKFSVSGVWSTQNNNITISTGKAEISNNAPLNTDNNGDRLAWEMEQELEGDALIAWQIKQGIMQSPGGR